MVGEWLNIGRKPAGEGRLGFYLTDNGLTLSQANACQGKRASFGRGRRLIF
jgi:hypothetical protein